MKIETSDLAMTSVHDYVEEKHERQSFAMQLLNADGEALELDSSLSAFDKAIENDKQLNDKTALEDEWLTNKKAFSEWSIQFLITIITGYSNNSNHPLSSIFTGDDSPPDLPEVPKQVEWTVTTHSSYFESEKMSYSALGHVTTDDGRTIDIAHTLSLEREFKTEEANYFKETRAIIDPLVINYNNDSVKIDNARFSFDLDSDGLDEEINFLQSGSGYLAYDKNGDGKVNNGNELFGTQSGNGFKDLSEYDEDGNGWIDEGDEVFDDLQLWTSDDKGNKTLMSLKEANIGAIGLQHHQSQFSLTDENNLANAFLKTTGVALSEDGEVKTVQQIDLTA